MGLGLRESFPSPLVRHQFRILISFGVIRFFSIKDCAPSTFLGSWALVVPYLCSRFHIFDRPVLEEYIFQVEGGPHLL
jgi:hypothetical protein